MKKILSLNLIVLLSNFSLTASYGMQRQAPPPPPPPRRVLYLEDYPPRHDEYQNNTSNLTINGVRIDASPVQEGSLDEFSLNQYNLRKLKCYIHASNKAYSIRGSDKYGDIKLSDHFNNSYGSYGRTERDTVQVVNIVLERLKKAGVCSPDSRGYAPNGESQSNSKDDRYW